MSSTITKIAFQKNNAERLSIFVDRGHGEEYGFSVDQDVLIKFGLRKGQSIDEQELEQILFEEQIKKGFNDALKYLSYRMRSSYEVTQHLQKKEFTDDVINKVLQKLTYYKFIDDLEFAKAYVRTQKRTNVKGAGRLDKDLKEKGISEHERDTAMLEYPNSEQFTAAFSFAEKQVNKLQKKSQNQFKQTLYASLQRKGFSSDIIQEVIKTLDMSSIKSEEYEALCFQGEKALRKYSKYSGWERDKRLKQFLYQRGFSGELIEKFMQEQGEENPDGETF